MMVDTLLPDRKIAQGERPSTVGSPPTGSMLLVIPAAALALGALSLTSVMRGPIRPNYVMALVLIGLWAGCGALLLSYRVSHRLGLLVSLGAVLGAATLFSARLSEAATARTLGRTLSIIALFALIACCAHVVLSLPEGVLRSTARRAGSVFVLMGAVGASVTVWAGPGHVSPALAATLWLATVAACVPAAQARYRSSVDTARHRMQWLALGIIAAAEIALVVGALSLLVKWPSDPGLIAAAASGLIAVALAASTRAPWSQGVERALVQTASVVGFSAAVVAVYLVIVLGLGTAPTGGADRKVLGLSMVAAAVAAVSYIPLRARLLDRATGLVYGARSAPDEVLRTFGTRMTRAIAMDELLLQLAESLHKTMDLTTARVFAGSADVLDLAASVPDQGASRLVIGPRERPVVARAGVSGNAWIAVWLPELLRDRVDVQVRVAPAAHSGELLGLIVVERRADNRTFTEAEDSTLAELARQVGLALHNMQLDSALQETLDEVRRQADELRASRARIVASADAERRKVERDLHDGAQQHLVALAVNLRLARDMVGDDPAAASAMLAEIAEEVKATVQELRDLAHGIYPPLLVDSGLGEALRAAGNRSPLAVRVDTEGIGRYEPQVETAVYFCCLEALQNAAKHAPDATVDVRLREEAGGLHFSVIDDGPGYDPAAVQSGHGYINMSDRLGAIGGTVRWESTPGSGATVTGTIPLDAADGAAVG